VTNFIRLTLLIAIALACATQLAFAEDRVVIVPGMVPPADPPKYPGDLLPGRVEPESPADAVAYRLQWDGYTSLVVIGPGNGIIRPCWVVTFDGANEILVAYRAKAYHDKDGILHVDAREAVISGPKANQWSPDSFAITPDNTVYTLDDGDRGNAGSVLEKIVPEPGGVFERLLGMVQAMASDSI
jgi:hypothetical protein